MKPLKTSDLAPAECVVCGLSMNGPSPPGGFVYLTGTTPLGAMACNGQCVKTAIDRWKRTGRCDVTNDRKMS